MDAIKVNTGLSGKYPRIAVDLDGIIYKWTETMMFLVKHHLGIELNTPTYWDDHKDTLTKEAWNWVWTDAVTKHGLFRYGSLCKGAREGLVGLAELGKLVVISARPESAHQDTIDWLAYQKFPASEIHILGSGTPKSSIKCDFYIDDAAHNAEEILLNAVNSHMLLWDFPWNEGFATNKKRFHRVHSWPEIYSIIKEFSF